ncbi:MAG: hypothetical protein JST54_34450 [Deltaproteobacteria bacterium]|nr:hypothetical protein [Deltaproteobacteria bacterium]
MIRAGLLALLLLPAIARAEPLPAANDAGEAPVDAGAPAPDAGGTEAAANDAGEAPVGAGAPVPDAGGTEAALGAADATAAEAEADGGSTARGLLPSVGGEVRGFFVGIFPYPSALLPPDPMAEGALDLRLKLGGHLGDHVKYSVQPVLESAFISHELGILPGLGLSLTAGSPQAVDLTWKPVDAPRFQAALRFDRLLVAAELPHLTLTVGRQPISFGTTFFFQPEDLVAPFTPTTIDREYKPGVDALRADVYLGVSGQLTAVVAYAGAWNPEGVIGMLRVGETFDVWDVGLFAARVRGDGVLGADTAGSLGAWAVRSEVTVTFRATGDSPFLRAVVGVDRQFDKVRLAGEAYLQTLGATHPDQYLPFALTPEVQSGELWSLGREYVALSADDELSPIVHLAAFTVTNLADPSFLAGADVAWSVADNADLEGGLYYGLGARPVGLEAKSEFGLYPATAYLEMKSYF